MNISETPDNTEVYAILSDAAKKLGMRWNDLAGLTTDEQFELMDEDDEDYSDRRR